jgi:transcriptional regulator with XRE-family HTH domain
MDLGLTQRTLAEQLGCVYPTVAAWESGGSVPLAARWPAIEAVLGRGLVPMRNGLPGRVRTMRLRLGWTQAMLASRANLDVRTIRNVESGHISPSPTTLTKLSVALGTELG